MNDTCTTWFRPNGSRLWQKVGHTPDRGAAWKLMFNDPRSGGWYVCEPGRPEPTPQPKRPPKPASRQGVIPWD